MSKFKGVEKYTEIGRLLAIAFGGTIPEPRDDDIVDMDDLRRETATMPERCAKFDDYDKCAWQIIQDFLNSGRSDEVVDQDSFFAALALLEDDTLYDDFE